MSLDIENTSSENALLYTCSFVGKKTKEEEIMWINVEMFKKENMIYHCKYFIFCLLGAASGAVSTVLISEIGILPYVYPTTLIFISILNIIQIIP